MLFVINLHPCGVKITPRCYKKDHHPAGCSSASVSCFSAINQQPVLVVYNYPACNNIAPAGG